MENKKGARTRGRRKNKWMFVMLWVLICTVCALLISFFAINAVNDILGFGKPDSIKEITVDRGMNIKEIASLLKSEGVIEQPGTFILYSKFRNRNGIIQAGDYVLNSNMGYDTIISAMQKGNNEKEVVKLTFYEGMSALDIANRLEKEGVCKKDEFLNIIDTENFGYEFENMIPDDKLRFRNLEGYLFPDTYEFFINENPYSVAKKFVKNFNEKVFRPLYDDIRNFGMTLDQAVTLASVIQKEASLKDEMYKVSSVFHNRLDNPSANLPMLQSDVTIDYVEDDIKPFHTMKNQEMYDAYNTYVCEGLPKGPICSPGIEAIKAAISPEETDYYYFVTDANGKYYYSKTFEEHNKNVRIASSVKKSK